MLHVLGAFGTIHPRHLECACGKLKWEDIPSPLDRFPKGTDFDLRGVIPNHRVLRRQKDLSICDSWESAERVVNMVRTLQTIHALNREFNGPQCFRSCLLHHAPPLPRREGALPCNWRMHTCQEQYRARFPR